ncbi:MAG: SMP-30/gluconolactonase/LRE family protein [Actinomycetota bacterium]|nr:SMP-30/gluconolactonase/LRE family protein [Actinomycetota bacterium]MDQ6946920.1 SMP-30/gluconolactonase/LRE family protein [Actinomycetota bacterium]
MIRRYRRVLLATLIIAAGCVANGSLSAPTDGLVSIGAGLRGPSGLQATVYAQAPAKVAALALDPQGRLWVATADFTDAGGDGVYLLAGSGTAPVKVIDGLHTPLGLVWNQETLYVSSRERVDAYRDFDGSRFRSQRTVLSLPEGVGESNGLVVAPDGRLTMGISAPCDNCTPSSPWSGRSCRSWPTAVISESRPAAYVHRSVWLSIQAPAICSSR